MENIYTYRQAYYKKFLSEKERGAQELMGRGKGEKR